MAELRTSTSGRWFASQAVITDPHCDYCSTMTTPSREFAYTAGAEDAMTEATATGWTVISMANDWIRIFT